MKGLPSSIIRKYGVTKKAWAVFRSGHKSYTHKKRGGGRVAKKRHSKRSSGGFGGFGLGKLLSIKNIMLTVAGAALLPKVVPQVSPNIGGAIGGYMGSKSIIGAVVGYLLGPMINGFTSKALGGVNGGFGVSAYN